MERFQTELETSTGGGLAGALLNQTQPARPELAPVVEFGKRQLQRTRELGTSGASPSRSAGPAAKGSVSGAVAGGVPGAKLIERVLPVYPPLAKQARIQGTVLLSVIIAEDGSVKQVQLLSGHPLLAPDRSSCSILGQIWAPVRSRQSLYRLPHCF